MKPVLNGRVLYAEKQITLGDPVIEAEARNVMLRFQAEDVRKERTGTHAKVHIIVNGVSVAWDQFNVERHADRRQLVNHAYKSFGSPAPIEYGNDIMIFDFGQFCELLWVESLGAHQAEEMSGDPNIEQRFLAHPHILEGGGTILFAPGGRGKSYTALTLAVCIDAGIDTFWPVNIAKVMYINLERSRGSMQRRLGFVNRALGLDEHRSLLFFNGRGEALAHLQDHLAAEIERKNVQLVILDSISRTGAGNLNENQIANRISDTLNGLCPTWLGLAHTPRQDERHIFGSTHFDNVADITVRMHSVKEEARLGVGLEMTKANDLGFEDMKLIGYEFGNEGLKRIWPATESDFAELVTQQSRSLTQEIVAFLRQNDNGTSSEIAEAVGRARNTVNEILSKDNQFLVVGTTGRAKYYGLKSSRDEDAEIYEA